MIAYLDSSVILRLVLGQPGRLKEWEEVEVAVTSHLTETECLRTLDRFRLVARISDAGLASRRSLTYRLIRGMERVEVTSEILSRASNPLPTVLGTLDAIHLATAEAWREWTASDLVFATHDAALGRAARACGVSVIGV